MKHYIHFAQPLFGREEKKELLDTLDSGWVTLGPRTKQFEEETARYVGSKYAVGVTSCTAGLHLALLSADVGSGDEAITSIFTFAASANTIIHVGATPVLVDIDPKTFNIDPKRIEERIGPKTKAIVVMHYGGQPADMEKILRIAKKHKLVVIEDAATAIGASYKKKMIGNIGDLTCFSFHPIKNISTGDGGMVTTNNKKYAERLMILRLHGMSKDAWKRHSASGSWRYDIVEPGYKYNMTDIQAALGIHQLRKLESFMQKRDEYANLYDEAFSKIPEITLPFVGKDIRHARNLYTIEIDSTKLSITRDELVEKLKKANIGVSVYYIPLHTFTFYKKMFHYKRGDFPIAERIFERIISLPLYPKMRKTDIQYITKILIKLIQQYRQ